HACGEYVLDVSSSSGRQLAYETNVPGLSGFTTAIFGSWTDFVIMRLRYYTDDYVYAYIMNECGSIINLGSRGPIPAMTDAQVGLVFINTVTWGYGWSSVDWFYSDF
ncbi:MAG: hypothetical protein ACUVSS_16120, partial [Anaerolineae bacterium]